MIRTDYHIRKAYHTIMVTLVLAFMCGMARAQQPVQFSQYMFNGLAINPAYAGADEALSLTFLNRSQWRGLDGAPVTQTLSGHTLFRNRHVGLGFTIINDKIGVHKSLTGMASFAYRLQVARKSYLSFGLRAGVNNQKSDYVSISGNSGVDPKILYNGFAKNFLELGAGIYFKSPRFDAGLSLPQMLPRNVTLNDTVSISFASTHYYLFSRYRIPVSDNLVFEPSVLLKYYAGTPFSYDINANLVISKALTLGLSYRNQESIDFLMKAQVTPQLQLGYCFDYVISNASKVANVSHELMVNYLFRYSKRKVRSPR